MITRSVTGPERRILEAGHISQVNACNTYQCRWILDQNRKKSKRSARLQERREQRYSISKRCRKSGKAKPVMDGMEATRTIRQGERGASMIPIIAMTANAMSRDREECLATGMNDYLSKPVNQYALAAILEKWLPHNIGTEKENERSGQIQSDIISAAEQDRQHE